MSTQLSPKTLAIVLTAVIMVLGGGGWFGLVASQRSTASDLGVQLEDGEASLAALQADEQKAIAPKATSKGKATVAETKAEQRNQLALAFPRSVEMPSILLQVQRLATKTGVTLDAFAPTTPTVMSGYQTIPIDVTVSGGYREVQSFIRALRTQAGTTRGRVHATGRLFSVETLGITAGGAGLPSLTAALQIQAFIYTGVPVGGQGETVVEDGSATTAGGTG
jgi:Tfp pilus assembly protein PilO